ncbi:hypothetical protein [Yoonia sp.]|uniref:hypothetical protein n=1 Tax=Yoonia sp. TaxID=2212373 RepID=UPI0019F665E8|nr:hypothetical protein [Yoonia sp.]MBE0414468.1 hypothetical protein [Yoonia sp.]
MKHVLLKLSNDAWRTDVGRRFETTANEAYDIIRWTAFVGFARYLSQEVPTFWFIALHLGTSALLFGHLAARFLLRPEVPLFAALDRTWKRAVQTGINYALCLAAFVLLMLLLNHLVDGIAQYRFASPPH